MAATAAISVAFATRKLLTSSSRNLKQPLSLLSSQRRSSSFFSISSAPLPLRRPQTLRFSTLPSISATISVGDKLPDATLSYFDSADELQTVSADELTSNKKVILFAVPGAFTPTCSQKHLPGFAAKAADFKAKGVDTIDCISVNDAFVMKAWKKDLKIGDDVLMLSDGNGDFTGAIG
ncbi:hypothetical protein SASPL_102193 [Salvia splendens]|uniref:Glutaredoxin-dependent peroxiredoxin n=2 Tax=Salvia splendens TaxID=180675 RepID=A0A8X8YQS2_SALSN|nr:hypothetical protein SASPL_102193 [Salvia splendens]